MSHAKKLHLQFIWHEFNHMASRQVYHSSFVDPEDTLKACGCPLLPLKSHIKGPAPVSDPGSLMSPVLFFIKPNYLFLDHTA